MQGERAVRFLQWQRSTCCLPRGLLPRELVLVLEEGRLGLERMAVLVSAVDSVVLRGGFCQDSKG